MCPGGGTPPLSGRPALGVEQDENYQGELEGGRLLESQPAFRRTGPRGRMHDTEDSLSILHLAGSVNREGLVGDVRVGDRLGTEIMEF